MRARPGLAAGVAALAIGLACAGGPVDVPEAAASVTAGAPQPVAEPTLSPEALEDQRIHTLAYAPGPHGVEDATFSTWRKGDALFSGVDDANLRAGPATDAAVAGVLALGQVVDVLEVGATPEIQVERRNVWVRVSTRGDHPVQGWVFGAILTPLAFEVKTWDAPAPVLGAVTFSPDFRPRVRFGGPHGVEAIDLDAPAGAGGRLSADVVAWGKLSAGVVRRCAIVGSGCTDHQVVHTGRWVERRGDAPGQCSASEPFQVRRGTPRLIKEAKVEVAEREPDRSVACFELGRVAGGKLVSCTQSNMDKGARIHPSLPTTLVARFVVRDKDWTPLPCASDGTDDLEEVLWDHGVSFGPPDPTVALPAPFTPPDSIDGGERGALVWVDRDDNDQATGELFVHPTLGAVLGRTSPWSHAMTQVEAPDRVIDFGGNPEGKPMFYDYRWEPATLDLASGETVRASVWSCGNEGSVEWALDFAPDDVARPVDRLGASPVYDHKGRRVALDAWDRAYYLQPDDDAGRNADACEPVIYLYADPPQPFTVRVDLPVSKAIPAYPPGGWSVVADPGGRLALGDGRHTGDLFWEANAIPLPRPDAAYVVPAALARPFLVGLGGRLGLVGRELDAFADAWAAELGANAWNRVGVYPRAVIDEALPLTVDPAPDTVIRVLLDIEPLDVAPGAEPPVLPVPVLEAPPPRHGTVLVEWGAMWRLRRPIANRYAR